jgi:hypothetical protein
MSPDTTNVHGLAAQLQQQQQQLGLRYWTVRACSICSSAIGYAFPGGVPYWDSGCDCANLFGPQRYTWADVALHYILHPAQG